jgi:hypothetical protein
MSILSHIYQVKSSFFSKKAIMALHHFATIDGMGTDANGKYFHFVDNSTSNPGRGDNYANRLYYNPATGIITGKCNTGYTARGTGGHDYIVTQVRKSIKN